jgi:putative transposase
MIAQEDRRKLVLAIEHAQANGARLKPSCAIVGIDVRTFQRWKAHGIGPDRRPGSLHLRPAHALSSEEKQAIVEICNQPRFADLPPGQIVPILADDGKYLASESSIRRVLGEAGQNVRRGRSESPKPSRKPTTHVAVAPRQVWCWDVTWLTSRVKGQWFYLYVIIDLYSRMIVAWEVHETESGEEAAILVRRAALREGIEVRTTKPVLHGDNGRNLKATTVLAMCYWLGIRTSYSRPRVSNDNAHVESLFRSLKYCPQYPSQGFLNLDEARQWAARFVHWYNTQHRHSALRFVTPYQRHHGLDQAILGKRQELYRTARDAAPRRWSTTTRNWEPIGAVTLNPEKDDLAALAAKQALAA